MIKTDEVVNLLEENKKLSFDKIWSKLKSELVEGKEKSLENQIKSDLYLSMMINEKLIMLGDNVWALKEKYTKAQIKTINEGLLGQELTKVESLLEEDGEDKLDSEIEEEQEKE